MSSVSPLADGSPRKSWLDRALSIFADVRAGEGGTALLLAVNIFCILAFYSVLKVVRDTLILAESGAQVKSYSAAGQAALLLLVVPLYGAFASRVNRLYLVCGVTLFFASHLVVFYALGAAGVRIGIPFFLWAGIFNLVVISQFWAFSNDLFTADRGRRLFPVIGIGASLGAFVGAGLSWLGFADLGPYRLMLIAAFGLILPTVLTLWVNRRERAIARTVDRTPPEAPLSKEGGFRLVFSDRYLLLIALMMITANLVNTLGGYILDVFVKNQAQVLAATTAGGLGERELIGTINSGIATSVNLLALLFQAFLVSRLLKVIGVRGSLFVLPAVALVSYSFMAFLPIFSVIRIAKILENSTDYSIQNTARHALFLPTSREAKYKAKQAIDSFFVRTGDMLQAAIVYAGTQLLALSNRGFAVVNIVFVVITLVIVSRIYREHKRLTEQTAAEQAA
jgi:ATP:ADP antiporter, AAA family